MQQPLQDGGGRTAPGVPVPQAAPLHRAVQVLHQDAGIWGQCVGISVSKMMSALAQIAVHSTAVTADAKL
jgi:hypothetical protein